jgi:hypothetical protein
VRSADAPRSSGDISPSAGNVLRPKTQLVLSLRIPPTIEGARVPRAV